MQTYCSDCDKNCEYIFGKYLKRGYENTYRGVAREGRRGVLSPPAQPK